MHRLTRRRFLKNCIHRTRALAHGNHFGMAQDSNGQAAEASRDRTFRYDKPAARWADGTADRQRTAWAPWFTAAARTEIPGASCCN